jgi:hypothetical protein
MFRKLKSDGGVFYLGDFLFCTGAPRKKRVGRGEMFSFLCVLSLSLSPFFLIFVCMCGYLRGNSSFSFSCVVVMRFVGITGMGFHLFYFVSWGLGESQRV